MIDAEMEALLSGYAAGTLTPDEEKRLFEKALNNQTLFDALADEESMRAALASPLVRQSMLRLLKDTKAKRHSDPGPNKWLWVALAASIFIGAISVYYWPRPLPPAAPQQVAVNKLPEAPPPAALPPSPPKTQPATKREELPKALIDAKPAESAKAEQPPSAMADNMVPAAPSERARAARAIRQPNTASITNDTLSLQLSTPTYVYAFLIDGEAIKPIAINNPASTSTSPLPAHSAQAEVWLHMTPSEDPVLARALTGVLPLPNRPWTKLRTNP